MIGFGRIWSGGAARKGETAVITAPGSTIPRSFQSEKPLAQPDVAWNTPDIEAKETRSSDRFVPRLTRVALTLASGKKISGRIINVSRTGVAVEADFAAAARDRVVMVGGRQVVAGRRITLGCVFLFDKPLDAKACHPDIVL